MNGKLFGGTLLIAGTCIGGGMLGLPIATASGGLISSSLLFVGCWMLMSFTALLTLEVNLCFPRRSNVISMAKATLGRPAEVLCWTVYLFFLYALVAAYVAGGQDLLHSLLMSVGLHSKQWVEGTFFVAAMGAVVTLGTKHVDILNRVMMAIKFSSLIVMMGLIASHVRFENYLTGHPRELLPALTVVVTSFGFSIIVPSLREYFHDDIRELRIAILAGSFIPLVCYLVWVAVIFGAIPLEGEHGLAQLMSSDQPVSSLVHSITYYVSATTVMFLTKLFTSICVLTAFLCVSLSLSDYLADGLRITKHGTHKWLVAFATFVPPLCIAIFYPRAFIMFLSFAGLCCVLLQALMPAMMAWNVRYTQKLTLLYEVRGGKPSLWLAMASSILIICVSGYYLSNGMV